MVFARRVFLTAGIYGLILIAPQLFLEAKTSRDYPPAITHPEFYYGFVSTTLAWQIAFIVIGRDPVRFRPLMPAAFVEKVIFGIAGQVLYLQGRVPALIAFFAGIDLVLLLLFLESWRRTRPQSLGRTTP